jgi:hypothetical protein
MGILRTNRFKENTPFEVKDFHDEPISVMTTVKETYITACGSPGPFERESSFKTGSENTFKSTQSK